MGAGGHLRPPNTRPTAQVGPATTKDTWTDLFHPSQDDVRAPPVVHGDLQADPQRPAGTDSLSTGGHLASGPTLPAPRCTRGQRTLSPASLPSELHQCQLLVCRGQLHPCQPSAAEHHCQAPKTKEEGESWGGGLRPEQPDAVAPLWQGTRYRGIPLRPGTL